MNHYPPATSASRQYPTRPERGPQSAAPLEYPPLRTFYGPPTFARCYGLKPTEVRVPRAVPRYLSLALAVFLSPFLLAMSSHNLMKCIRFQKLNAGQIARYVR